VAQEGITVNAILPTTVKDAMIMHDAIVPAVSPDLDNPTADDMVPICAMLNAQGIPWRSSPRPSPGVLYLVSDEAANVTGGGMDVGAGWNARNSS
jgi:(+)-trans-carveol dehydrogenase